MKILVSCVEDRAFEYRCEVGELNYSDIWPHFWMRCVMGDDRFQRVSCNVETPPIIVRPINSLQFVLYQTRQDAEAFAAWLSEATAAVAEGFRKMRG